MENIRNFSIIAHIDHGKSTLADRFLELTGTIEKRRMREQVLDSMELERERGITIKMQPVRMIYTQGSTFVLNLIDTPGHIDFSYEVSRALSAVEGSILLVDATQGVEAQTLTTLSMARDAGRRHDEAGYGLAKSGLVIIPVISKIDSPLARIGEVKDEITQLLEISRNEILLVSGKTGEGVKELLDEIIKRIPPPTSPPAPLLDQGEGGQRPGEVFRALVFDFQYSEHRGVIVFVRVFSGAAKKGDKLKFKIADKEFSALEVGVFLPEKRATATLGEGEIGYIVTGIKEPGVASVGDTVAAARDTSAPLPGYGKPAPVVWASVFPENQDDFPELKRALTRLRLSDSALSFEEESSGVLGRGFRVGFLGMLHLEIATERLHRESDLELVVTSPSVIYKVSYKDGREEAIHTPSLFPESHLLDSVKEPWVRATLIVPPDYLSAALPLLYESGAPVEETRTLGRRSERTAVTFEMPLRELMYNFFDRLKSATSGFGSLSYEVVGDREASVTRLEILVADEPVAAFTKVVSDRALELEAEETVERLAKLLPRQLFDLKIQARAHGRIIASRALGGLKKNVTGYLYGGDITRKRKLWEKQKKGKRRMKARGKVKIPPAVFVKMMRLGS